MHPAEAFIHQFKARRYATDRTDKLDRCKHDAFGDDVPYIAVEAPRGIVVGWVALALSAGAVEIMWIETKDGCENRSHGDQMLNELCALADKLGVTLVLQPAPWDEKKLGPLIDWYEKNGFVLDAPPRNRTRYQRMTRIPR